MLKIHKSTSKKLILISITSILSIGVLLGLTYHPSLVHAEDIVTYPEKEKRDMSQITYMQDITPEICQNSELNKQYTLTDSRDEKTYTVARIKNQTNDESNCWMTQNLRLINKEISYLDSDMLTGNFTIPISTLDGFVESGIYKPRAYYDSTYGGYYNWYTATAGLGGASMTEGSHAPYSICPKGWKLPMGEHGKTNEFYELVYGLITSQITVTPYKFTGGGIVAEGKLQWANKDGHYWASTVSYSPTADTLTFVLNTSYVNVTNSSYNRYYGNLVRCVTYGKEEISNNVEITINNTITLEVDSEIEVEKSDTNPSTAALPVSVASNQPYAISVSSASPNLTSATNSTTIPSKPGLLDTAEDAWGMKLSSDTNYTQISSTPATLYTATVAEAKTTSLQIGVSASPDLPNGEYSTDITITAVQN